MLKIGDLVRVKNRSLVGVVVGEEYIRSHQYLERDLYFKVLVSSKKGTHIKTVLSYDCEAVDAE